MPLHKSSRASRLDHTMISAPLGDFRHTMHIGRGGDAFGDTSFLSTLGPAPATPDLGSPGIMPSSDQGVSVNHRDLYTEVPGSPENSELQHSESVSSFTLDLDLDLGPSMLGDVLGVMDGLGFDPTDEDVFTPKSSVEPKQGKGPMEMSMSVQNELNGKDLVGLDESQVEDDRIPDGNSFKAKGLRPKVRFSDKREEITRQASEEEEGQGFDLHDENLQVYRSPVRAERGESQIGGGETMFTNHKVDLPPSPASSHSSEYEGVTPLDRRRVDSYHSETDSEDEEEGGRGYTFEDEFDDEIGL
ncbi:cdc42 effector protein 5 [Mastacembelus armatus]|uniref:CDC42 effector protein (Rho GTPase binding) 5 n=1 Tax=Mastacembelus armatus TaxID=205130 RepID=A0A7N8XLR6_9TELE|nr:cdc42 effector protein 5 [Mastacembelus armatus]